MLPGQHRPPPLLMRFSAPDFQLEQTEVFLLHESGLALCWLSSFVALKAPAERDKKDLESTLTQNVCLITPVVLH